MATVLTTSTALEIRKFAVNPGLAGTFPWLCDVANRFDKYKFVSLAFTYVPNSPAVTGNVTMAFDFDPNDAAPSSADVATQYHDFVSTSVWKDASLRPDLAGGDKLPQKDTRPGMPLADIDLNVYDVGNLFVLTEGAAAATVGFVEVTYTVDLFIHQVQNGIGAAIQNTDGLDATHLFGDLDDVVSDPNGFLPGTITATNTFVFDEPFQGILSVFITGAGLGADLALHGTATSGNLIQRTVNAGLTQTTSFISVKAARGQTLVPTVTAAGGVTGIVWAFSKASYDALDLV